ncbi:MAG: DUF4349 domain-containing protein [Mycobacteriales bacterium]|nr:DUF4349 domain-containing protein [Frankia sp.]
MIDEALLERALEESAGGYDPPSDGPDRVLAAARAEANGAQRPRRWRITPLTIAASLLFVLIAGVAASRIDSSGRDTASRANGTSQTTNDAARLKSGTARLPRGPVPAPLPAQPQFGSGGGTAASGGTATGGVGAAPGLGAPTVVDATRIIKTGDVSIQVERGQFDRAVRQLTSLATAQRGYVASSKLTQTGTTPRGSVVLRVPADNFERTIVDARGLGKVLSQNSSSSDVTAEYVDLTTRLRTMVASRERYVTLLSRARTIGEILSVQSRIDSLQVDIEQLQGRQKLLDDQTAYSVLTVNVAERGAASVFSPPKPRSELRQAFHDAGERFTDGVDWLIAASGTVLFLLLLAAGAAVALRITRHFWRRRLV